MDGRVLGSPVWAHLLEPIQAHQTVLGSMAAQAVVES